MGLPEDMMERTDANNIGDEALWAQIHAIYFPGEGILLPDLIDRWNIVRTNTEFDLHAHEFKQEVDQVPDDILNAFNSAQGQKRLKRVAANLLNRDTVIAVANWRK